MLLFVIKREGSKCYSDYSKQLKSRMETEPSLQARGDCQQGVAVVWLERRHLVTREARCRASSDTPRCVLAQWPTSVSFRFCVYEMGLETYLVMDIMRISLLNYIKSLL